MFNLVTNIQGYSIHDGPGIRTVVFLKGCSLNCQWCSNPECISPHPEIGFFKHLCTGCGKCIEVCPSKALVNRANKVPRLIREKCDGCGKCVSICSYKALVLYGREMKPGEVFDEVKRDRMFYQASGGGVTVSGGEALLQPEFVCDLFKKCRHEGIHTCIETSGYAPGAALRQVLPFTDYVLFDLKHMDPVKHRRYTGKPNKVILINAEIIVESGVETLFRMPLIPGINDDPQNIKDTADFLHRSGNNFTRIELMPYHRLGKGKYESLDKPFRLNDIPVPEPEYIESVKNAFEANGITCLVSR